MILGSFPVDKRHQSEDVVPHSTTFGDPSRKAYVVNSQMTMASNK